MGIRAGSFMVFFLLVLMHAGSAQKNHDFTGILLNATDSLPLTNVHLINRHLMLGTISNADGEFTIPCEMDDTVEISIVGFKTIQIESSFHPTIIYLTPQNYELAEFSVLPYQDYTAFKRAFVELELPEEEHPINPTISVIPAYTKGGSGIVVEGLISGLLTKFNKHLQDKKHVEELQKQDRLEASNKTKFNPTLVKRFTQLTPSEVADFMEYCDFDAAFIAKRSKIQLWDQLYACLEEYKTLYIPEK